MLTSTKNNTAETEPTLFSSSFSAPPTFPVLVSVRTAWNIDPIWWHIDATMDVIPNTAIVVSLPLVIKSFIVLVITREMFSSVGKFKVAAKFDAPKNNTMYANIC